MKVWRCSSALAGKIGGHLLLVLKTVARKLNGFWKFRVIARVRASRGGREGHQRDNSNDDDQGDDPQQMFEDPLHNGTIVPLCRLSSL